MIAALVVAALAMVGSHVPIGGGKDAVGALGFTEVLATENSWFCAATLVTVDAVVTAKHCLSGIGTEPDLSVRWRRYYDGTIGTVEAGPNSFAHSRVGSWYLPETGDVAIGYLEQPVKHIAPIEITLAQVALGPITLAGWGREGPASGEGPIRRLLICANEATWVWFGQVNFCSAWNQACWAMCGPNNNDSGGPVIAGGRIYAVITGPNSSAAFDRYVGDQHFEALVPTFLGAK